MHPLEHTSNGTARSIFSQPLLQLAICIMLVTASELLLKRGATETADLMPEFSWLGFTSLSSGWVWLGILFIILSFASWLYVLQHVDLSAAYAAAASIYALVPIASWMFFGDASSAFRWLGIALIVAGLLIIAPDVRKTELI